MEPLPNPKKVAAILLRWHKSNKRNFPWREKPEPYRVLVAEFFLQRTPAERVAKFYTSFLEDFPTIKKLAEADPKYLEEIGKRLGLKKRMSWLIETAKKLLQEYGGRVPDDYEQLIKLPGVGRYTASAVLCFAFKRDVPIVDANVVRVLTRVFGLPKSPRTGSGVIEGVARKLMSRGQGTACNEALLDFAAIICKKRPLCYMCPLARSCDYYRNSKM